MSEKKRDPSSLELAKPHPPPIYRRTKALAIGICLGVLGVGGFFSKTFAVQESPIQVAHRLCPQVKPITPVKHSAIWDALVERSASDEHKERTIQWLSEAVQIRCVSCPIVSFEVNLST